MRLHPPNTNIIDVYLNYFAIKRRDNNTRCQFCTLAFIVKRSKKLRRGMPTEFFVRRVTNFQSTFDQGNWYHWVNCIQGIHST